MTSPRTIDPLLDPALGLWGYWYAACPASQLGSSPIVAVVGGQEIPLWRDSTGRIATNPDGPRLAESDHYVWAFRGRSSPSQPPPGISLFRRQGYAFELRTVRVKADYRWVLENSLDFSHGAFAHPFTQPSWLLHFFKGLPPLEATYRPTKDGLEVEARLGKWVLFQHSFALPDRLRLVILPNSPLAIEIVVLHVPEGFRSCRMEVLLARRAMPWEGSVPRFYPGSLLVHRQDITIIEAQQAAMDMGPMVSERHCEADAYTLLMRRILASAAEGRWDPGAEADPRTIRIRI